MARSFSGTVLWGSKNIYTIQPDGAAHEIECKLKGKILKGAGNFYNPIAPGDRIIAEAEPGQPLKGIITALEGRRNYFSRFNQKGHGKASSTQLLAANIDLVLCLTTRQSPPFRPRFIDRVLLQADIAGINAIIVCNKSDLNADSRNGANLDANERLEDFKRIGYEVAEVSAKTGLGLDGLGRIIAGKRSVLIGQSGVGKSSLINALVPGIKIKTGALNEKYNRGNHTTTLAFMAKAGPETWIIDTPGLRRFVPAGISEKNVILYMREFAPLAAKCTYGLSCSHRSEPGCKILEAVDAGVIHEDRYESFLRIHDELSGQNTE
jgi:ribosome biogenesis GTPase